MTGLLGPNGQPISSKQFENKKAPAPKLGEQYGNWSGENVYIFNLPGGGAIQFNLDNLTLLDFRQMKDHYQINASFAVLTFLMHQMEWWIDCEDKKQKDFYTEQIENVWTRLVRALSQAFWAGFSPNVLQWENDTAGRRIVLDKVKDLVPEDCHVRWKKVDGATQNGVTYKTSIYDGIKQFGSPDIPVENSLWYPLLMENGNYYGKKLLRPAFTSWFFSILLHLFANRYYERFGEPTPLGRAPYDEEVDYQGTSMKGNEAMSLILQQLRSRSTVVLPNDKTQFGEENTLDYDYQIEYLESQMRGADFERYMTRLDEEMSLALFTPILLMRTADVGSYNLGTQHAAIYKQMLDAISGDWADYINKYVLRPLRDYNFGTNAPRPRIKFRRLGAQNDQLVKDIATALINHGVAMPDLNQLSEIAGLDFKAKKVLTKPAPAPAPAPDPNAPDPNAPGADPAAPGNKESGAPVRSVAEKISERIHDQVRNAFRRKKFNEDLQFSIGFQRQFEAALEEAGHSFAFEETRDFYARLTACLSDLVCVYRSSDGFMDAFEEILFSEVDRLLDAA